MEGYATDNVYSGAPPANPWVAADGTWVNMELALWNNAQNTGAQLIAVAAYGGATQTHSSFNSLALRIYALASYLLAVPASGHPKMDFSYQGTNQGPTSCTTISYYPEWELNYGTPTQNAYYDSTNKVYRRAFTQGEVFVNPSSTTSTATITFSSPVYRVTPAGANIPGIPNNLGGDNGNGSGTISEPAITSLTLPPYSAAIVLNALQTVN
jgi:hypothetical protein